MKRLFCVAVGVHALLYAADPSRAGPEVDPVAQYGLESTTADRTLLEAAAKTASDILASTSDWRIIGSWAHSTPQDETSKVLKVYLVKETADSFMAEVPDLSCNCIFIQPSVFRKWLTRYSTDLEQMMAVDERYMLAFMLLHEVGHVVHGDPGAYAKEAPDYNYDDSDQKVRENGADAFAGSALRAAADDSKNLSGFLGSMRVRLELSHVSWNLQALRQLGHFGGSSLCSKMLFADKGASHPNLELRVLTVSNLIEHTTASEELLRAFEACRPPSHSKGQ